MLSSLKVFVDFSVFSIDLFYDANEISVGSLILTRLYWWPVVLNSIPFDFLAWQHSERVDKQLVNHLLLVAGLGANAKVFEMFGPVLNDYWHSWFWLLVEIEDFEVRFVLLNLELDLQDLWVFIRVTLIDQNRYLIPQTVNLSLLLVVCVLYKISEFVGLI